MSGPVHDLESIQEKTKNGITISLDIVDDNTVLDDLDRAGVNKEENKGFIDGPLYLLNHSNTATSDGATDFTFESKIHADEDKTGLFSSRFYITKVKLVNNVELNIAHNRSNFGNYMWGAAANALGVGLPTALTGAHVSNFFNDTNNSGVPYSERSLDSSDDQFSIMLGWLWRNGLSK